MKVKKIIAAVSCAALITAAALPLTACGGKEEKATLDISKYAATVDQLEELSSMLYDFDKHPQATLLGKFVDVTPTDSFAVATAQNAESEPVYTVYNTVSGKELAKDLKEEPEFKDYQYPSESGSSVTNYLLATSTTTGDTDPVTTYDYIGEDGTVLLDDAKITGTPEIEVITRYVGTETEESNILSITYTDENSAEQEKYFKIEADTKAMTFKYTSVEKSALKVSAPEYAAGSAAFGVAQKIYADPDFPVTGGMEEYSYAQVGSEMVFYKGTSETGRVNIENVDTEVSAFVNNYWYYTVEISLAEDNTKPDITVIDDGMSLKYSYEIHRYDIVAAKDEVIEKDYYIENIQAIYNNTDKVYDAAVVTGYKVVDGVRQYSRVSYLTDAQLTKAYDVTGLNYQLGGEFVGLLSLGNDKYAVMGDSGATVVTDKDLNPISKFSQFAYMSKENVVMFAQGSNFGLADIDGKVIAEPKYTGMPIFYGGKTFVQNAITGKNVILGGDGSETVLELDGTMQDMSGYDEETYTGTIKNYSMASSYGIYYIDTYTKDGEAIKSSTTVYNLDGSAILSFDGGNFDPSTGVMGRCFKITFVEEGSPVQYLYSIAQA